MDVHHDVYISRGEKTHVGASFVSADLTVFGFCRLFSSSDSRYTFIG